MRRDRKYQTEGVGLVACWYTGGSKGPEQLIGDVMQYYEGTPGVGRGWGVGGRGPG